MCRHQNGGSVGEEDPNNDTWGKKGPQILNVTRTGVGLGVHSYTDPRLGTLMV